MISSSWSMLYGCSSEPGGEVGDTGWWQQMVDASGWIVQFLKEITTQFVTSIRKRRKVSIVKCRPIGRRGQVWFIPLEDKRVDGR